MRPTVLAALLLPSLFIKPVNAQVRADVIISGGPVAGRVTVGAPAPVVVYGEPAYGYGPPAYGYPPATVVVVPRSNGRGRGHAKHGHWKGYRQVVIWERDGWYYDRPVDRCRQVVVWEQDGRYYLPRDGATWYRRNGDRPYRYD